jgi:hypothetical protein
MMLDIKTVPGIRYILFTQLVDPGQADELVGVVAPGATTMLSVENGALKGVPLLILVL